MNTRTEELFLSAEADIRNNNFQEAFQKYEEILYEEPAYAPAHNSMGWLFKTQFDNYSKAERHFRMAVKSDPDYPHAYYHIAGLLLDLERFDELEEHLNQCLAVRTIDKSWVYHRFGLLRETAMQFQDAIAYYEKALLYTMNNDKIKDYQADAERCRIKWGVVRPRDKRLGLRFWRKG